MVIFSIIVDSRISGDERTIMGFLKEFKDFINRGNVMDMAVGIIIGAAFTAIVTSLTNDTIVLQQF